MSTEVTPDMLRAVAAAWEGSTASDDYARHELRARADWLERELRPLPSAPGWYPTVVVERGYESCTGALKTDSGYWVTATGVDGHRWHHEDDYGLTIRWAEQDGTTPGQTLWEARFKSSVWSTLTALMKDRQEYAANAVLAAHGTPTLTPVGEHPKPGTRGLLPVVMDDGEWGSPTLGMFLCAANSVVGSSILVDPRPDGAHE